MSSILKGIVNEGEDLAVVYIDGKPSVKYANNHEAIADVKLLRQKFPNKSVEIKYEVREDDDLEELDENLRKWFKEKWVRFGPDGKIRGACARGDDSEGKPKCLPQKKAHALGKKGRKYAASKKRREDPNPERRGPAKNVATKKKTNEGIPFNQCPECGNEIVHESMMNEKKDACYHKVKARYKVWPSAYASGALVQCRKKGASNWGTGGKKNESNIMKGLVAETEMMNVIYVDGHPLVKYVDKTRAESDAERIRKKFPKRNVEVKREMHEGVIVGHDANDPDVAILGGAGTYKLSNVKKKAQMEANELAKDIMDGKFKNSAINVKQLANTLNTIVAAEDEMEKKYFGEDYTGEFAAEKTPAINPYGGLKDNKIRGAIGESLLSEMPDTSGAVGVQPGGWREYSPKPAGQLDEALPDVQYNIEDMFDKVSDYYKSQEKGSPARGLATRLLNALWWYKNNYPDGIVTRNELLRTPNLGRKGLELIDNLLNVSALNQMSPDYYRDKASKLADEFKAAILKKDYNAANTILKNIRTVLTNINKKNITREDTAYATGMGQGGNAGQSYRKFKPKSAGTFKEDELDEACWKGYHKEGMKTMFGKKYPNCVKNTNEEVDEGIGDTIKKTALGLGTAAALVASPVQAKASDVPNAPSVTQQAQPTVYKEKLHPTGKAAKKYGLSDLYNDIFSPGQDEETLLKNIRKIHDGRPPALGQKVGALELIPSDRNDADYIARINYQNGRLDIYLQKGGMLRSALVPFIDKTPTGKKKKYIMLWANWTVGSPQENKPFDFESTQLDEKCWDTHKQVGMKKKGGKQVPNCVPKESAIMKGLTGKRR